MSKGDDETHKVPPQPRDPRLPPDPQETLARLDRATELLQQSLKRGREFKAQQATPAPAADPRVVTTIKQVRQRVRGMGIILIVGIALVAFAAGIAAGMQIGYAKGVQHAASR